MHMHAFEVWRRMHAFGMNMQFDFRAHLSVVR